IDAFVGEAVKQLVEAALLWPGERGRLLERIDRAGGTELAGKGGVDATVDAVEAASALDVDFDGGNGASQQAVRLDADLVIQRGAAAGSGNQLGDADEPFERAAGEFAEHAHA